jgi:hypothetical protein
VPPPFQSQVPTTTSIPNSRLRSQHQAIAGPRDDPHETLIVHLRQSPAIWRRPECHDLARQRLRSVQGAWQDVHGAVP